ncbi:hypothetical protein Agabi119p4_3560 [Agaricus bisporus var. burnettii]|uniref:Uncharacterized protein n=1 Tax=Agaricus bisporus var. burnettii TaxID=192524 RepID=A0A8H7KI52_AGABI|nr:hypothetical protein Agabi119p4_3560 [Agaricus bisporus var. burnettii]
MDLGLKDLHVLVTGASGGIGFEISRLFLEQGAKVSAHYNSNHSSLQSLVSEYGGSNRIQTIQANLTQESEVIENVFNKSTSSFGEVHILVLNHAAIPLPDEPIWEMPLERWKNTIDTNVTASFIVAKEYVRRLQNAPPTVKDNASVVIIGSTAGKYGEAGHADYAASKSALMYGFTLSLKNEIVKVAPKGRVNSIGPGWVKTPKVEEKLNNPRSFYRAVATTPLKKVATPHDIATQTVILASQKVSGHITGQVLMIEGGMEGRLLNLPEDI